jgi:LacI family transcriptional regulator
MLGLSVSQVSAALKGNSDVSEETRRRVEAAAKSLNYSPNLSARKLVSGRSGIVALVVREHEGLTRDATFVETVAGLSREFSSRNMQFVLHIAAAEEPPEQTYGRLIGGGSLDGFVLTEPEPKDARIAYLQARDVPFVVHGNCGGGSSFAYYEIDNFDVGYKLAGHLVERGHRRIALLNGRAGLNSARQRQAGVEAALKEVGAALLPELTRNARFSESYGLVSLTQMFSSDQVKPTAVVCGNMSIARGVYRAADAIGLVIPDDLSVVAHDDCLPHDQVQGFSPDLTVSTSDLSGSWGPLADILIGRIEGKALSELQIFVPIDFVARASVSARH